MQLKLILPALAAIVICSTSCKKTEQVKSPENISAQSKENALTATKKFGVFIGQTNGITLNKDIKVNLAHDLGVSYVRISLTMDQWNDPVQRQSFLDAYKGNTNANPPIEVLLNINLDAHSSGLIQFTGATLAYKNYVSSVLDTLTSAGYTPPALVVIENEENNTTNYVIKSNRDLDRYIDQLKYGIQACHQRQLKVANGSFTELGLLLLTWDYYYTTLGDTARAAAFMDKIRAKEIPLEFTEPKFQKKLKIVQYLINAYPPLDIDYFNFHWYEPVKAVTWLDTSLPKSFDTNHITPGVIADILDYLYNLAPIAGKTIITNETGQLTSSADIPIEITNAFQGFPIVSWYDSDGKRVEANARIYKAIGLHTSQRVSPPYILRPNGITFRDNIANIMGN